MIRDQVESLLRRRPFQPVRVFLTDGRTFDIPYVGMSVLAQNYINIGIPISDGPYPLCRHSEHIPLQLIDRIEETAQKQPSVAP